MTKAVLPPVHPVPVPPPPPPPTRTETELKALYGGSQVQGDDLPAWLSDEAKLEVLRVHCFGDHPGDWKSLVVVTPLLKVLIDLDPSATIDLARHKLSLPKFGKELELRVAPGHLKS